MRGRPSHGTRTIVEEHIISEIRRVGVDGLDRAAIVKRYCGDGKLGKTTIHEWINACIETGVTRVERVLPPPPPRPPPTPEELAARAEAKRIGDEVEAQARETAAIYDAIPTPAQMADLEAAVSRSGDEDSLQAALNSIPALATAKVLDAPPGPAARADLETAPGDGAGPVLAVADATLAAAGTALTVTPYGADAATARIDKLIEIVTTVLNSTFSADGKVRNARMALTGADTLRRVLETSMKFRERLTTERVVENFMTEVLAEVSSYDPASTERIVAQIVAVQARWAA